MYNDHSESEFEHEAPSSPSSTVFELPLDEELRRDEERLAVYGGDDPREPSLRTASKTSLPKLDSNLVTWDGPKDPANPQNWSRRYRWFVTWFISMLTVNVTFASSAPSTATRLIAAEFGTSKEVSYLVTTVYLLGYVFGPMFWGPGSELVGRRPVFVITLALYTIFHLGQALAPNMQTLLVTRALCGFFAVAPLVNTGGVIADIWDPITRGPATTIFSTMVFIGPVTGPIVGGFITDSYLGWRWVFWVMMMFAGACTVLGALFIPETYAPVILAQKARRLRKEDPDANKDVYAEAERQDWSFGPLINRTLYRPFKMLIVEPTLLLVTVYLSVVYGVLYALFEAVPIIFEEKRGFTTSQTGLVFIGVGVGAALAAAINMFLIRKFPEWIREWRGFPPPERRLYGAMVAGPCLIVGIFWLGWTGQYPAVPWYVPALALIPIGCSVGLVFISFLSYLVDTYLMYSASAFAANTMCRSAVAAAFPLFTVQLFHNLGVNWAATLIGCIGILLAPLPLLFYKWGAQIRSKSKFAPCLDLKVAKQLEQERRALEKKVEV
ncbi:major facilitator superfamily domain-containing protein [Amylostereum chailletii]|nr:major facilitator superfamily domain-containing protein [Amylostereum chailletii]